MIKHQKLQMIWMNNDHTWSDTKDELSYKELSWHDIFKNLKKKNEQNRMIVTFCFVRNIHIFSYLL